MKKIISTLIAMIFIITACHKKAVPTFTTRSIDIPAPKQNTNNATPDLAMGKSTYTAKCNRCHDLPDPAKYDSKRWDGILSVMTFRARLSKEETNNVTAYIKANCSK